MNKPLSLAVSTLALLATLVGCDNKAASPASPAANAALPVPVANPTQQHIAEYADYTGRLEAVEIVDVRPRVSGYIESIHFTEGQKVKAGDLLYVIDARPFQAQVNRLQAQVNQAEAARSLAKANLKRAEKLIEVNAISQEEADIRNSEALQAEADVAAAIASLEAAHLDLEFTQVIAPIDGIADRREVTVGNLVVASETELTTIVPHSPIYAYYEVDERAFLRSLRRYFNGETGGRHSDAQIPAWLGLDDEEGYPHQGIINFSSNQLNPNTATLTVRALFQNEDEFLTPGLFARIRVATTEKADRILIPDTAIGTDQTIKYVWALKDDNSVERRTLELGPTHEGLRIVRSGLSTEDRIIVSGIQFIRPGMTVDPQAAAQ
ncbi:efflux RND transporter periplasmic adaptor subunit [Coraliomargarita sp. SDUM461004]|uniref:Efflux RND transporter periplasmic adaptor subunit n=1 Tax=Thalassobacterium sedimentorum TaxID=3041258 RepID=A0ABU1AKW3_9BACT|nr:efflux RND transporter periplasmic adaptor subunit [Coraliomargarita sp. SDUM461004]MDQ8195433.1 efflux RND transporter periplasmic adaptor subunit [Coraliomargarita sp. SDUM461004]